MEAEFTVDDLCDGRPSAFSEAAGESNKMRAQRASINRTFSFNEC